MKFTFLLMVLVALVLNTPSTAIAEGTMIDDFESHPESRWQFIADTVMGGVSTGKVSFDEEDAETHARLTGSVSTRNNGGFIQFRMKLLTPLPESTVGLRLVVRGNDQRYFVHLRTSGTLLPWQYYQAGFEVNREWAEVRLPFEVFKPSGSLLRAVPSPNDLRSVGIVAFGRDHQVEIDVREISYY